jgi:AraC-like DNA-binding protein
MHKNYTFIAPTEYYLNKCPELLFIQYDTDVENKTRKMHAHDFWQLEMVVSGCLEVKSQKLKLKAVNNDCILIPPGIPHRIIYGDWEQRSWSIKFKLETQKKPTKIILMKRSAASITARNNILRTFNELDTTCNSYISLQYLLGMLIELELQSETFNLGSALIAQVKTLIDSHGGHPFTINELADELQCSRNHISKKFHMETGTSLKSFIDVRRVETARKMLLYSDQKIITIAEIMEFADVYSFSRFFNRLQGCSPRQYRIQNKTI